MPFQFLFTAKLTATYNIFICQEPKPLVLAFDASPDDAAEYVLRGRNPELRKLLAKIHGHEKNAPPSEGRSEKNDGNDGTLSRAF